MIDIKNRRVTCAVCGHGGAGPHPPYNCNHCGGHKTMDVPLINYYASDPGVPYNLRTECFEHWLKVCTLEMPVDPHQRRVYREAIKKAFEAGWNSRKQNVDYALKNPEPRWHVNGQPNG